MRRTLVAITLASSLATFSLPARVAQPAPASLLSLASRKPEGGRASHRLDFGDDAARQLHRGGVAQGGPAEEMKRSESLAANALGFENPGHGERQPAHLRRAPLFQPEHGELQRG